MDPSAISSNIHNQSIELPGDVFDEIFSLLPESSRLAAVSVCKLWNHHIVRVTSLQDFLSVKNLLQFCVKKINKDKYSHIIEKLQALSRVNPLVKLSNLMQIKSNLDSLVDSMGAQLRNLDNDDFQKLKDEMKTQEMSDPLKNLIPITEVYKQFDDSENKANFGSKFDALSSISKRFYCEFQNFDRAIEVIDTIWKRHDEYENDEIRTIGNYYRDNRLREIATELMRIGKRFKAKKVVAKIVGEKSDFEKKLDQLCTLCDSLLEASQKPGDEDSEEAIIKACWEFFRFPYTSSQDMFGTVILSWAHLDLNEDLKCKALKHLVQILAKYDLEKLSIHNLDVLNDLPNGHLLNCILIEIYRVQVLREKFNEALKTAKLISYETTKKNAFVMIASHLFVHSKKGETDDMTMKNKAVKIANLITDKNVKFYVDAFFSYKESNNLDVIGSSVEKNILTALSHKENLEDDIEIMKCLPNKFKMFITSGLTEIFLSHDDYDKAIKFANCLQDGIWVSTWEQPYVSKPLSTISRQLASKGYFDRALEVVNLIRVKKEELESEPLMDISIGLASIGNFDRALEVANLICSNWCKSEALRPISIGLIAKGCFARAFEVAAKMPDKDKQHLIIEAFMSVGEVDKAIQMALLMKGYDRLSDMLVYVSLELISKGNIDRGIEVLELIPDSFKWKLNPIIDALSAKDQVDKAVKVAHIKKSSEKLVLLCYKEKSAGNLEKAIEIANGIPDKNMKSSMLLVLKLPY